MKYFIDTCVWRDFLEDGKFREETERFFSRIKKNDVILISKYVLYEMSKKYSVKEIEDMFTMIKLMFSTEFVEANHEQRKEVGDLSEKFSIPLNDCLYAVLARDNGAILITQDKHMLTDLKHVAKSKRPRDIT